MTTENFFLELSENDGVSHKFYEITINDTEVTICYGRIGTTGRTHIKVYPTPEKAKAEKKLKQKKSKGDRAWMVRCDNDTIYHGHSRVD